MNAPNYRLAGSNERPTSPSRLRRNVLRALAFGGSFGGTDAALAHVGGEPFFRGSVRAAVARAVESARAATSVQDTEHIARVAFLREAGLAADVHPDDVRRVSELHAEHADRIPRGGGFWPVTTALLAAMTAVLAFLVYKKFEPSPEEKFRKSPFGVALGDPLSDFVIALDKGGAPLEAAKSSLLTDGVKKQLGSDLFAQLESVLDKTAKKSELQRPLDALNDGLVAAKIPGYLDSYTSPGGTTWLLSFYAGDRAEVAVDGEKTRVTRGRRVDSLNLDTTFYVWIREDSMWTVVSLEMVEEKFGRELLPTIGGDRPLHYGDHLGGANSVRLSKALAEPLRNAFVAESGVKLDELKTIQDIVAQLEDATDRVKNKKGLLVGHGSLLLAPQELKRLEKSRGKGNLDLDDAFKAHERLVGHREGLEKIVAIAADIDEQTFVAERLLGKKKAEPSDAAREAGISSAWGVAAARARLALIADGKHAPAIYLEDMVRDVVARGNGAINVVIRELAKELGRKLAEGSFESAAEALLNNVEAIVAKPREEVSAAARKVHERLFGGPPPHYERTPL